MFLPIEGKKKLIYHYNYENMRNRHCKKSVSIAKLRKGIEKNGKK